MSLYNRIVPLKNALSADVARQSGDLVSRVLVDSVSRQSKQVFRGTDQRTEVTVAIRSGVDGIEVKLVVRFSVPVPRPSGPLPTKIPG